MGATMSYETTRRAEWDREFREPWETSDGRTLTVGEPTVVGTNFWAVLSIDGEPECLMLAIVDGPEDPDERGTVTFRAMSEASGPYVYNVPLAMLDLTPEPKPGSFAAKWRAAVRDLHARGEAG